MTFQEISMQAAQSFLKSVVIVDDKAGYNRFLQVNEMVPSGEPAQSLEEKKVDEFAFDGEPGDRETSASEPPKIVTAGQETDNQHSLNASILSRCFAKQGLVCGIIKPDGTMDWTDDVINVAESADILVLDWDIYDDDGKAAMEIAKSLFDRDVDTGSRLRLIAFYTGRDDLKVIHEKVHLHFGGEPALTADHKNLALKHSGFKVIFLCKGTHLEEDIIHLACQEAALPERLVNEFSRFAGGLLSNVALATLGEVRRHTFEMLGAFSNDMDGPYLSHRTLIDSSGEAEDYALDIIWAEIDSKLPKRQLISNYLCGNVVKEFLSYRGAGLGKLHLLKKQGMSELLGVTAEEAFKIVEEGERGFNIVVGEELGTIRADFHTYLHPLLTGDVEVGELRHLQFSRLTTLQREWNGKTPTSDFRYPNLQLGSVIRISKDLTGPHALTDGYYLCMQPLCDSVRIRSGGAPFIFIKLNQGAKYFDFIVQDVDKTDCVCEVRLLLAEKHPNIITPNFIPKHGQDFIESHWDSSEKRLVFHLPGDRKVNKERKKNLIYWVAELKPDFAQRLSHRFATQISRIGLDEFEWQRRFAKGQES